MHQNAEALISKKDLLQVTGISYGQLYRWKRQSLIPEAWFIKQSSFTGQETFFPRDKILKRIQMITDLKDQYSLEELADLLSPSTTNRSYNSRELLVLPGVSTQIVKSFESILNKDNFTFRELVFIHLFSLLSEKEQLDEATLHNMVESLHSWLPRLKGLSFAFVLCRREEQHFGFLIQQQSAFHLDHKTEQVCTFDLEELAKDLNLELNQVLEGR